MTSRAENQCLTFPIEELDEIEKHRAKFFRRNGIPFEIVNGHVVRVRKRNRVLQDSLSYDIWL
ncbi:MAG: hypothetical protein ACTSW4_01475 [Candidatus Ranarchaeia archaeon]